MSTFEKDLLALMPRMNGYAMTLTRNSQNADDLVQDMLERALRARDQFEPGTNMTAWLLCIMRNRWLSGLRGPRAIPMKSIDDMEVSVPVQASQDVVMECKQLFAFIDELPAHQRNTILLAAVGFSYEDIAEHEDIAVGTVKSRISRLRDYLRGLMEGEDIPQALAA